MAAGKPNSPRFARLREVGVGTQRVHSDAPIVTDRYPAHESPVRPGLIR